MSQTLDAWLSEVSPDEEASRQRERIVHGIAMALATGLSDDHGVLDDPERIVWTWQGATVTGDTMVGFQRYPATEPLYKPVTIEIAFQTDGVGLDWLEVSCSDSEIRYPLSSLANEIEAEAQIWATRFEQRILQTVAGSTAAPADPVLTDATSRPRL